MRRCIMSVIVVLALPAFVEAADAAEPSNVWTRLDDNDPAVTYSPGMEQHSYPDYYDGGAHTPRQPGEWCAFSFAGTGVNVSALAKYWGLGNAAR
jgi:hypothetical protein